MIAHMARIHGLNRLTLVDYPGKMAAILFTGGCNFRCPFCHNSTLVLDPDSQPVLSHDEIFSYLEKRRKMLDGVVVTGGEPTLESDLETLLEEIKDLGYLVKLDTNGYRPSVLASVIGKGLVDYVAMDIKNSLDAYPETVGIPNLDTSRIVESISILEESGVEHEYRTTVVRELHYEENFEKICHLIPSSSRYFLQTFVPSGDTISKNLSAPSHQDMENYLKLVRTYIEKAEIRDSRD